MARERYVDQVRLLVDILPAVAAEDDFALKGGTAINLFYRDLPRLSVDIDLTFLPIRDRVQSLADIDAAMDRIASAGSNMRGVTATRIAGGGGGATRVLFRRASATVKVETSPVTRGVVFEPETKRVSPAVEDLYAGKLHAALDRQNPRDLFDVKLLYENEGITDDLFRAFLVYVASSSRPPHELLNPNLAPLTNVFEAEFSGRSWKRTCSQSPRTRAITKPSHPFSPVVCSAVADSLGFSDKSNMNCRTPMTRSSSLS